MSLKHSLTRSVIPATSLVIPAKAGGQHLTTCCLVRMATKVGIFLALTAMLLVACGDEVTEVTEVHETGMKIVEEGEKLPECTTENEGTMVYALDSAASYACINRKWTSFNGKDGADGKDGRDGKDGEDGAKGDKGDQGVKGDKGESGEKGDTGEAGTSCTMESLPDSSGFKVICGGDSVGIVLNGEKGEQGDKGEDGESEGCYLIDDGIGTVTLWCGPDGTVLYKAICGIKPYDPERQFCDTRDGKAYKYVTIGTQTWMAENLNYETANSWCYDDVTSNCATYGRLYTWAAAMDSAGTWSTNGKGCGYGSTCSPAYPVRGVCPSGWHLPTKAEFETLFTAVGGSSTAGTQLKSTTGWNDSGNGIDAFGFSALPAGYYYLGYFSYDGYNANFWSSTEYSSDYAYFMYLYNDYDFASLDYYYKDYGFSVRCLRD